MRPPPATKVVNTLVARFFSRRRARHNSSTVYRAEGRVTQ